MACWRQKRSNSGRIKPQHEYSWGGGVNAQATLPLGTVADVEKEVSQIVGYLKQDGGYVFNCIHNILAEIEPEKVIAMYRTAKING